MEKGFAGKTVIITGTLVILKCSNRTLPEKFTGASSGIGAGAALEFAKLGANLVLCGRKTDQLDLVKKQCLEAGLKEKDVSSKQFWHRFL